MSRLVWLFSLLASWWEGILQIICFLWVVLGRLDKSAVWNASMVGLASRRRSFCGAVTFLMTDFARGSTEEQDSNATVSGYDMGVAGTAVSYLLCWQGCV